MNAHFKRTRCLKSQLFPNQHHIEHNARLRFQPTPNEFKDVVNNTRNMLTCFYKNVVSSIPVGICSTSNYPLIFGQGYSKHR